MDIVQTLRRQGLYSVFVGLPHEDSEKKWLLGIKQKQKWSCRKDSLRIPLVYLYFSLVWSLQV